MNNFPSFHTLLKALDNKIQVKKKKANEGVCLLYRPMKPMRMSGKMTTDIKHKMYLL